MRVYEIAREMGLPNKELIAKIRALGLEVNNHMSSLDTEDVARVKRSLEKERLQNTVTKRLSTTVLRRRSKGGAAREADEGADETHDTDEVAEPADTQSALRGKPSVRSRAQAPERAERTERPGRPERDPREESGDEGEAPQRAQAQPA